MANRPMSYGLTGEIKRKMLGRYDDNLEQQARIWIEDVTGIELEPGSDGNVPLGVKRFQTALKSGEILCRLMNCLQPGAIKKINNSKMPFKQMENISLYLAAIGDYGLSSNDIFQTVDLYEGQNMLQVVNSLHALGRKAQIKGFDGPVLGVREAQANPRDFTEEQLKAGDGVIGLQMGTNQVASQKGMNFGYRRDINWADRK